MKVFPTDRSSFSRAGLMLALLLFALFFLSCSASLFLRKGCLPAGRVVEVRGRQVRFSVPLFHRTGVGSRYTLYRIRDYTSGRRRILIGVPIGTIRVFAMVAPCFAWGDIESGAAWVNALVDL